MRRLDVQIPLPDGRSHGTLHVPDGNGPWPGVLVFPDAGGTRETFRQMGDRLAGTGYVTLIPDIYYRAGEWAPFDVATLFTDERERARLAGLAGALTGSGVDHTLEFYPARHGFAVPDNPTYDTEADARHWETLRRLYRAHLPGS
jgi:dienelactone hydrolase